MNKCSICGANCESDRCWKHKSRKALKVGSKLRARKKSTEQIEKAKSEVAAMLLFFKEIWDEREHKSEVSGKPLGDEVRTVFFHHILQKSRYKEHAFNKENVILVTFQEHQKVEQDPYFYEEVNKRRNKLLKNEESI